ncbi:hypothetical protein PR202_ga11927 [Eleusine coracana subsp. coracana]|uniref:Uncharacterized protein n=1 Tax=Eleusine coracana subsp. coracana TaxID=191504 RepID=A0AAV5CAQ9_ELECO|nr:hypothetical protein PR202_ga11927 [Eleusine coracana subsp. coracana]
MADGGGQGGPPAAAAALKDQGNEQFKAGNYLKAAALYTQAIKLDPDNATLYRCFGGAAKLDERWCRHAARFRGTAPPTELTRPGERAQTGGAMSGERLRGKARALRRVSACASNRAAAFLQLVKLSKALADAETTVKLKPQWEKAYFRKGCVLEAMERYDEAVSSFQVALQLNPQNTEVSRKIKRLTQLAREKKRALDVESMRSNIDIGKNLESLKTELVAKYGDAETGRSILSFVVNVIESAMKVWHDTGKVDPKVNFLLDDQKTDTEKYAPVVNIDKVWKGQGSRKWKLDQSDGFFVQFESPLLRKIWFVPCTTEKGRTLCRSPETLDISIHEVLPRMFKDTV